MTEGEPEIVTPSQDEVAAYGGASGEASQAGPGGPDTPGGDQIQQWKDKFLRAKADFANYQRRIEKDHAEALRYANAAILRGLLGIIDDLERVLESAQKHPENGAAIADGVRLTRDKFNKTLGEFGVEAIEAEGQPFDPQFHEAIMEQRRNDVPDRTVVKQAARGYRLLDRVLRPAKVIVAKAADRAESSDNLDAGGA